MKKALCLAIFVLGLASTFSQLRAQAPYTAKVYEVKWRNANHIYQSLEGLFPGGGFAKISVNERLGTIAVMATEEAHVLISELIKKYDVPAKELEFQFYILGASPTGQGIKNGVPEEIRKVINEIGVLTRYNAFTLIDSPVVRAREGTPAMFGGKAGLAYEINVGDTSFGRGPVIVTDNAGKQQIRVDDFSIFFKQPVIEEGMMVLKPVGGVGTSFTIGDGETIVVGASRIQQREEDPGEAVITVVTARIVE